MSSLSPCSRLVLIPPGRLAQWSLPGSRGRVRVHLGRHRGRVADTSLMLGCASPGQRRSPGRCPSG